MPVLGFFHLPRLPETANAPTRHSLAQTGPSGATCRERPPSPRPEAETPASGRNPKPLRGESSPHRPDWSLPGLEPAIPGSHNQEGRRTSSCNGLARNAQKTALRGSARAEAATASTCPRGSTPGGRRPLWGGLWRFRSVAPPRAPRQRPRLDGEPALRRRSRKSGHVDWSSLAHCTLQVFAITICPYGWPHGLNWSTSTGGA